MKQVVRDFADHTTAHGWGNVTKRTSTLGKVAWIFLTISCTVLAIISIIGTFHMYYKYETKDIVEIKDEPLEFPSVTVCPLNPIAQTHQRILYNMTEVVNYYNFITSYLHEPVENKTLQHQELFKDHISQLYSYQGYFENSPGVLISAHDKDDFITSCVYMQDMCNHSDITTMTHHEHYNCFTFRTDRFIADSSTSTGPNSGLSMILYMDASKLSYTIYNPKYPTSGSNGARVVIHEKGTLPDPEKDGFDVEPGRSVNIALSVNRRELMKPPWGNCEDHSSLNKAGFIHTVTTCNKLCQQRQIFEKCGCVKGSLPVEPDFENASYCGKIDLKEWIKKEPNITALNDDLNRLKCQISTFKQCKSCKNYCTYHTYDTTLSQSEWPIEGVIVSFYQRWIMQQPNYKNSTVYSRFHHKMNDIPIDGYFTNYDTIDEIKSNFIRLNVYLKDSDKKVTIQAAAFDFPTLISEIGGFLGLYVGISIISIAEVMVLLYNVMDSLRKLLTKQKCNEIKNEVNTDQDRSPP